MATIFRGGRFKELMKKYGKVAFGVHCSVSAASIGGLYIAINNNVDVESILAKWHLPGISSKNPEEISSPKPADGLATVLENQDLNNDASSKSTMVIEETKKRNRTSELAASSGGALALAFLCNKVLFPVRVPITIALTPPVARFLARRNIIKHSV